MSQTMVSGQALGDRYTIERVLGQGGMATVHLAEVVRVLLEGTQLSGEGTTHTKATLAYARARMGDDSYAKQVLGELEEKRKHDYVSPVELAMVNIALGDINRALDWAEEAVPEVAKMGLSTRA